MAAGWTCGTNQADHDVRGANKIESLKWGQGRPFGGGRERMKSKMTGNHDLPRTHRRRSLS